MVHENHTEQGEAQVNTHGRVLSELLPPLRRLDGLLEWAMAALSARPGAPAADAPFRGLYISPEEARGLLQREPGTPAFGTRDEGQTSAEVTAPASRIRWLKQTYGLTDFEVDTIVVALAPELDLRYARLYAYLQDDVTRRLPTVELALNLLSSTAEEKLARHEAFLNDAPLLRHGIIRFHDDARSGETAFLARGFRLDEQITRLLLCQPGLDSRLTQVAQVILPSLRVDNLAVGEEIRARLKMFVAAARRSQTSSLLYLHGPSGTGKSLAAEAVAGEAGTSLLRLQLPRGAEAKGDLRVLLQSALREAWFHDVVLEITGLEALEGDEAALRWQEIWKELSEGNRGIVILTGCHTPYLVGDASRECLMVSFGVPDYAARRVMWERALIQNGLAPSEFPVEGLAERFRLTQRQIEQAASTTGTNVRWRHAETSPGDPIVAADARKDLYAATRKASSQPLAGLARKIEPRHTWDQLVLPADSLEQLRELCVHAKRRSVVFEKWGFDRHLSSGKGLNALFGGPPGTGKTMASEVISSELELDLYKINLANVISKYIGETEKNLDRIFTAAENGNAILFFDEADALFGRRSEVRDSHDRYANVEIAYLLQKMEEYEGISILATNLRQNLDPAFLRRLVFIIQFPFPHEEDRHRLWSGIWPPETPLAAGLDFARLARDFKLTGANIKNIALAAAFLAAEEDVPVNMSHILRAARREQQKLGRTLADVNFADVEKEALARSASAG